MSITGAIVLLSVIWFLVFFVVLQLTTRTQAEAGEVEPGTPQSAPSEARIVHKARITTVIALVLWAGVCAVILSGRITVRDLDFFGRMGPETPAAGAPAQGGY